MTGANLETSFAFPGATIKNVLSRVLGFRLKNSKTGWTPASASPIQRDERAK